MMDRWSSRRSKLALAGLAALLVSFSSGEVSAAATDSPLGAFAVRVGFHRENTRQRKALRQLSKRLRKFDGRLEDAYRRGKRLVEAISAKSIALDLVTMAAQAHFVGGIPLVSVQANALFGVGKAAIKEARGRRRGTIHSLREALSFSCDVRDPLVSQLRHELSQDIGVLAYLQRDTQHALLKARRAGADKGTLEELRSVLSQLESYTEQ